MAKQRTFKGLKGAKRDRQAGVAEKFKRLLKIYALIAQQKYPSIASLKDKFGVTERTIYRDLKIIEAIDPIEIDPDRKGYRFTAGDRIKKLTLDRDELLVLFAAGEAVSHLGEPLVKSFQRLVQDMYAVAMDVRREVPILVKIPDAVGLDVPEHYETISTCIKERRRLDMAYRAGYSGEESERRIDPYGLVFYDGTWIMIGHCHLRDSIRHFALDRIKSIRATNLSFDLPPGFSLEKHMAHSWGFFNQEDVEITIRFTPLVADYILRKKRWHPSERRTVRPDGSVELSFTVAGALEIKRWIYSWMPHVEVIAPDWLRRKVHDELGAAAKRNA